MYLDPKSLAIAYYSLNNLVDCCLVVAYSMPCPSSVHSQKATRGCANCKTTGSSRQLVVLMLLLHKVQ